MEDKDWVKYLKDKKIIAIDPGKNGGIVVYSIDRDEVIYVGKMPETPIGILSVISKYQKNSICYLEKVQGMPGQGGQAMFTFGKGFGWLEMALLCRKIKTIETLPQVWQKALQLGSKGKKTTNQWKTKLMERAQQLYPSVGAKFGIVKKGEWLDISDALLILHYSIYRERGLF